MSREDFATESGLITDYEGEVIDAWFAVDEKFGGTRLYLKQTTNSDSVPEITENFSVGGKWKSFDGGVTIENEDNPDKTKIHESSRYGVLLNRIFGAEEGTSLYDGGDVLAARGNSRQAVIWVGTKWLWEQVAKDYSMKNDDGTTSSGTSRYNLPVEFLGNADGSTAAANTAPATGVLDALGLSDGMVETLKAARAESGTHAEFLDKAIALDGVVGNDTLVKALADESQLYKELAQD